MSDIEMNKSLEIEVRKEHLDITPHPCDERFSKVCRFCCSNHYSSVVKNNNVQGPGFREWIDYYFCNGCSVVFKDPTKMFITKTS